MTKSWFRFNFLKRGFLLEDKNCVLSNLLRVENCSQKWRHYRGYGNSDVSIWPSFYLTHFTRKKTDCPHFWFRETFSFRKMNDVNKLKKFCRSKKYLSWKITLLIFWKILIYRFFPRLKKMHANAPPCFNFFNFQPVSTKFSINVEHVILTNFSNC